MRILHVLSQFEVTGAEAYAVTLGDAQRASGHDVSIVSDTLHLPSTAAYIQQPIGMRSYIQRWRNVRFLTRILHERNIDVVHAHSRAASWVCNIACRRTRTAFVSTVHGRQHLHASSRAVNIYGNHIIAVAESLRDHLITELGLKPETVHTIPNPIELGKYRTRVHAGPAHRSGERSILYVGRFSGPKGDVLRTVLREVVPVLQRRGRWKLDILAGGPLPADIQKTVDSLNKKARRPVAVFHGLQENPARYFLSADVVVGSGRVAIEALAARRPVVAFGESACCGLLTPAIVEEASRSNFGDTGPRQRVDAGFVANEIRRALGNRSGANQMATWVAARYDIRSIESRIMDIYGDAILERRLPATMPVLMYHRVVDNPPGSRHGIWVTTEEFRSQLAALRARGFSSVTFEDLHAMRLGTKMPVKKPVVITFDDGYEDNYTHAFPLLREFGFRAVIYLVTDKIRRTNFWDQDEPQMPLLRRGQIRTMAAAGMEFGVHTVTHPRLPELEAKRCLLEIQNSKGRVEELTGKPARSFAYPYGEFNAAVRSAVQEAGFTFAVAADAGPLRFWVDRFAIRRITMFPRTSSFNFWKKTQLWYTRYKTWKAAIR